MTHGYNVLSFVTCYLKIACKRQHVDILENYIYFMGRRFIGCFIYKM